MEQSLQPPEDPVAVPAPSEKAVRYHRSGNVIWAVEQLLGLALPALLLFTGLSAWLRTIAAGVAHGTFYPTLVVYLALLSALLFVIQLPISYYTGYAREHAYGLSSQRIGKWASDEVKGLFLGVLIGAAVLWVPYLLLRSSPERWWLWTGALALPFFGLVLLVTPVFIAPLFNKFGPMKDKALEAEVLAVAAQAGVEGARVFEVEKSVDTKKVNAYVTGVGKTKRIVLWDTLLARLTPRQTRFVVGHELGHYVLGHVWINIVISSALTVAGLYGVHRTADGLHRGVRRSLRVRPDLGRRVDAAAHAAAVAVLDGDHAGDAGPVAPPRARGGQVRAGAAARQPGGGDGLRGAAGAEPGRPAPRTPLQAVPRQPPADRGAGGFHQWVSAGGRAPLTPLLTRRLRRDRDIDEAQIERQVRLQPRHQD